MGKCRAYIESQGSVRVLKNASFYPSVAFSRQAGAGGLVVARLLVDYLEEHRKKTEPAWTLFDRNLVHQILEDHDLPRSIEKFYPEDVRSELESTVEEMLGLHPSTATMVEQTSKTIIKLANKGHAVLVGRGANIITHGLNNMIHVRLVAPLDFRLKHIKQFYSLSTSEALTYINQADRARARYVKRYFSRNIEDPLQYDLVINTATIGFEAAMGLIATAVAALEAGQGRAG